MQYSAAWHADAGAAIVFLALALVFGFAFGFGVGAPSGAMHVPPTRPQTWTLGVVAVSGWHVEGAAQSVSVAHVWPASVGVMHFSETGEQ